MTGLFRRIADYFGFGQLWRVVYVEPDGTRWVLATHWDEDDARDDAANREFDAYVDHRFDGIDIPGTFVAEKVK